LAETCQTLLQSSQGAARGVGLGTEVGDELLRLVHDAVFKALTISTWAGSLG